SSAVETSRSELIETHKRELKLAHARFEDELKRASQEPIELRELKEKVKMLETQNESLRIALWREQEERTRVEQQRLIQSELAQQRNDEAVARALNIVKRTEERIATAAARGAWPPPPPSH